MGFMVTFIDVNDDTGEAYGRSWIIDDPAIEHAVKVIARQHFGQPMFENTSEEAFQETKDLVARGETWQEARDRIMQERVADGG